MCTTYNNIYEYDRNLDGTATRSTCNKRCRMGLDTNIAAAARSSVREPNNPNFVRDNQDDLLKHYKDKREKDTPLIL